MMASLNEATNSNRNLTDDAKLTRDDAITMSSNSDNSRNRTEDISESDVTSREQTNNADCDTRLDGAAVNTTTDKDQDCIPAVPDDTDRIPTTDAVKGCETTTGHVDEDTTPLLDDNTSPTTDTTHDTLTSRCAVLASDDVSDDDDDEDVDDLEIILDRDVIEFVNQAIANAAKATGLNLTDIDSNLEPPILPSLSMPQSSHESADVNNIHRVTVPHNLTQTPSEKSQDDKDEFEAQNKTSEASSSNDKEAGTHDEVSSSTDIESSIEFSVNEDRSTGYVSMSEGRQQPQDVHTADAICVLALNCKGEGPIEHKGNETWESSDTIQLKEHADLKTFEDPCREETKRQKTDEASTTVMTKDEKVTEKLTEDRELHAIESNNQLTPSEHETEHHGQENVRTDVILTEEAPATDAEIQSTGVKKESSSVMKEKEVDLVNLLETDSLVKTVATADEVGNVSKNVDEKIQTEDSTGISACKKQEPLVTADQKYSAAQKQQDESEESGLALVNDRLRKRITELQSQMKDLCCELAFVGDRNWRLEAYMECLMHTLETLGFTDVEDLDQTTVR